MTGQSDTLTEPHPPVPGGNEPPRMEHTSSGRRRIVLRRFLHSKETMIGFVTLVILFLLAFLGPLFSPYTLTDTDFMALRVPPTADHWFGTNSIGNDWYTLTMLGMQKSLIIGLLVAVISTGLAAVVGMVAGYFGGGRDKALMWIVDLMLVIPSFLIIAILSPLFRGKSWLILVVLLAAFQWMIMARIVRGMTISLREREYILAAKYMGVSPGKILFRHILPNLSSLLIVDATINVSVAIIASTSLSYFGFGVQPPDVSLGTLIADGTPSATTFPWMFAFPAGLLVLILLAVNLLGDGLRDALDPNSGKAA